MKTGKWIATARKLPKEDGRYLAYWSFARHIWITDFQAGKWHHSDDRVVVPELAGITHWMPLPEAPKS